MNQQKVHFCATCAHTYVDALTHGYCGCKQSALYGNKVLDDEGKCQVYSCPCYIAMDTQTKKED